MATKLKDKPLPDLFPGAKFRASAQASVDAILAPQGIRRPVISMGNEFKNADSWTALQFTSALCDWCVANPGCVPSANQVQQMIRVANNYRNDNPKILLARTPDKLNRRTQLALVGGGYHEAWHTQYSKRDNVTMDEVWSLTQRIGEITNNGGKFDKKLGGLLKAFCAIIEDIRIERRGCEEYPGVKVPMHDLQDFILDLEKKSRQKAAEMLKTNESDVDSARGVLLCLFRDLGLGYNTQSAREAIDYYKKTAPDAFGLCGPGGVLNPCLQAAKALKSDDKLGYVRVSMECVIALWKAGQADSDEEQPDMCCPNCGASASNLVIRPAKDAQGNKKFGKAEVECKVCGFKAEVPMPDRSLDLNQQESDQDEKEQPEYEDFPPEDGDGGGEGDEDQDSDDQDGDDDQEGDGSKKSKSKKSKKDDKKSKPKKDKSKSKSKGDEDGDDDADGEDGDEDGEGQDGDEDGEGEGSEGEDGDDGDEDGDGEGKSKGDGEDGDEDGDDADGDSKGEGEGDGEDGDEDGEDGDGDEGEGDSDGDGPQNEGGGNEGEEDPNESGSNGAGGHSYMGPDAEASKQAAQDILGGDEGDDPLDSSGALTLAFATEHEKENKDLERGELPWNPYNPSADEARIVRSSNVEGDRANANKMLKDVKKEIAALRGRLRSIVRAQEMTDTEHGLRRGKRISERMLVDSKLCLMDRQTPNRAYMDKEDTLDTSLAMSICIDQSGSMYGMLRQVAMAMMVLTEPVEAIGGKVMAFGFRDGRYIPDNHYDMYSQVGNSGGFHRLAGVHYDVFKTWDERFSNVKWRFAHTQATGGTPMADGVQFGLTALNSRNEAHRILAVITDGYPNSPHAQVIEGQIRRAAAKGIHVLGIGITPGAQYVESLFPDSVYAPNISDLPRLLIAKLNEICDFGGRGRGKRMKLDNRMTKRVS